MSAPVFKPRSRRFLHAGLFLTLGLSLAGAAYAAPSGFAQQLAEAVAGEPALAAHYRDAGYSDLWTGADDAPRRSALLAALDFAPAHGLPVARYDADALRRAFAAAFTQSDRALLEAEMSRAYLRFARDLSSGALDPGSIDPTIKRRPSRPDPAALLTAARAPGFAGFLAGLAPGQPQYARLMREKLMLEAQLAKGGYGPAINAERLEMGDSGPQVVALRGRLQALGYLGPTPSADFDRPIALAVQRFQTDMGLPTDGIAGPSTLQALNAGPQDRLQAVIVALERLRWMADADFDARHIWVNQPAFTVQIIEEGRVSFDSRVVIGMKGADTRSPEFSDLMRFMVVNPSWSVPRSITTSEYLPLLREDPAAVDHLQLIDASGRVVPREGLDFAAFTDEDFPFDLRQAPSDGNALGKVKFMFPNAHNIYLHDTPAKSLFAKEVRAFSHGCIRVGSPFDLAYALLGKQTDDPKGLFRAYLDTGRESRVDLEIPVPVHLVYFTAWPNAKGVVSYLRDVYGRDGRIFDALREAGLEAAPVQG